MAFKETHMRIADTQVRRVNSILRQAASIFGTESIQYQQRKERVLAALGEKNTQYFVTDNKTGALQVRRTRAALESVSQAAQSTPEDKAEALTKMQMLIRMQEMTQVSALKGKMLDAYIERRKEEIREDIDRRIKAGETGIDIEAELRRADPAYVDPSIKGRKARAAAKKQQIEAAIKSQATYYKQLNDNIRQALNQLYAIERELGEGLVTEAHQYAKDINRGGYGQEGRWNTEAEKKELLRRLQEEIARQDHQLTTAYESGLGGSILGIGGMSSGQL